MRFSSSRGFDYGPDGSLYIADAGTQRIYKVDPEGVATIVAGAPYCDSNQCFPGDAGDGGPATDAQLAYPTSVAVAPDGSIYIGQYGNQRSGAGWGCRIRKVTPDGIISTIAGNGGCATIGDGGPAIDAQVDAVVDLAFGPDGSLYLCENERHRIRRIDTKGIITRVAGGGTGWDGGPAVWARLANPR